MVGRNTRRLMQCLSLDLQLAATILRCRQMNTTITCKFQSITKIHLLEILLIFTSSILNLKLEIMLYFGFVITNKKL